MKKKKWIQLLALVMSVLMIGSLVGCSSSSSSDDSADEADEETTEEEEEETEEEDSESAYPIVTEDTENQELYADEEEGVATEFAWFKWEFEIDADIDTAGEEGDGVGVIYFRLYTPEIEDGEEYPVVLMLGGLGSTNCISSSYNGYAAGGVYFASESNQAENPCYVLTFNVPYEACVNYEAELEYVYQFGEIAKYVAENYESVDTDRIYATGKSQGAGWSYELASVQPDLLAAIMIDAGTTVHTTWGDQIDMEALANSDVNIYIQHGSQDIYIPVNEAYRTYNTLVSLGKTNIILEITDNGHCNPDSYSADEVTKYMEWMFEQVKGVDCTDEPILTETGEYEYEDYLWAGYTILSTIDGWATAIDYTSWTETAENATWELVKENGLELADGEGGTGEIEVARVRIGDETQTTYDSDESGSSSQEPVVTVEAGGSLAVTVQGYTGGYGDDFDAFNEEWDVDWVILEGSVTNIEVTCEASEEAIARPSTVTLANGGGPNVNNSLETDNVLDGEQTYILIDTAEDMEPGVVTVILRFTRDLGDGEYASYCHTITFNVE